MIELLELDLCDADDRLPAVAGPAWILVRAGSHVLGQARLERLVDPDAAREELLSRFHSHLYADMYVLATATPDRVAPADVSVVVCTRNRPALLEGCLESLCALDPPPGEILVVDNAPEDDATARTASRFGVRTVVEARPGLDRARNRGWQDVAGAVVAYLDDDARADRRFAVAVGRGFCHPQVAAVTGLVVPGELRSPAQLRFELVEGGMGKGFQRRLFHKDARPVGLQPFRVGVGTNMAFRRDVLATEGGFDPRLDVGTATRGGGDLDMLYRVLQAGHVVLYEPDAVVRHLHRRDERGLRGQLHDYGVGYTAFLAKCAAQSPQAAQAVRRERRRWHLRRHVGAAMAALARGRPAKLALVLAEANGSRHGRRALAAESGGTPAPGAHRSRQ